jgi:hypothetical protein
VFDGFKTGDVLWVPAGSYLFNPKSRKWIVVKKVTIGIYSDLVKNSAIWYNWASILCLGEEHYILSYHLKRAKPK